jgi:two-component system response regulator PilR (NtrC family)
MDAEAYEVLSRHGFPGNVRELENLIERAVALSRGPTIGIDLLPSSVVQARERREVSRIPSEGVDLERLVADYERSLLSEALRATGGVKKRAARLLGISFRSFRYRLEKLGIEDPVRGD